MAELLKNIYSEAFISGFGKILKPFLPDFKSTVFKKQIFSEAWADLELKQRMRHIATTMANHLPEDFEQSASIVVQMVHELKKQKQEHFGLEYMLLPDYIEVYGIDHFELSMNAFEEITQFTSCEFGVRPFLLQYPNKGMKRMARWSTHKHPQVRRLSTEGCRPRLPWAMALPTLKKDPSLILPILERLKNDDAETVRRSVANNLNDISKDNPGIVIELAKKWKGNNSNIDWIVKHGCRTLLKQGEPVLMPLFGYGTIKDIEVKKFIVLNPIVYVGEYLEFEFQLSNKSRKGSLLRMEYAIYYQKANGSLSKKVYKISEKEYEGNSIHVVHRKQSFKIISTRKLHPGLHQVALILNGQELERFDFELSV